MADGVGIRLGIAGALGRMGRAVAAAADQREGVEVAALFDRPGSAGQGVGDRVLTSAREAVDACDVIVDFTTPEASAALARAAVERRGPALVIGSTGFTPEQEADVRKAAAVTAVVKSGNYSLGVNTLIGLVEQAARTLRSPGWDVEVLEAHHNRTVDAPSGTALRLGEAAARGRGLALDQACGRDADGRVSLDRAGARAEGTIGFAVVRGGGVIGEHSVILAAEDEILTLSHSARDRSLFAKGALAAALWAAGRPPGLYDMLDVLGFRDPT